jgi:Lon protease-like protein
MEQKIDLQNFSGNLPLFPLPHVVLFPNTMLPLHIFERRYRKMLKATLKGEKMIGIAVLKPGWEENYEGNPEIYPAACMGTILKHEHLHDGRSNVLLLGLKRVKIKNIVTPLPYRTASVAIMEDCCEGLDPADVKDFRRKLLHNYSEYVIEFAGTGKKFPTLSNSKIDLSYLIDAIASSIGLPIEELVRLLEEIHVGKRAEYVLKRMEVQLKKGGPKVTFNHVAEDFPRLHLN